LLIGCDAIEGRAKSRAKSLLAHPVAQSSLLFKQQQQQLLQLLFASSLLFDFLYESNQERRLNYTIKLTKSYGKKKF